MPTKRTNNGLTSTNRGHSSKTTSGASAGVKPAAAAAAVQRALRGLSAGAATGADRATAELTERAASEGLLDIAYASLELPVGRVLVASSPRGLLRVSFPNQSADEVLAEMAASVSPRILEAPERLDSVRRELDEYFSGKRTDFDLALDWRLTKGFRRRVLRATARIPYGETVTYADVARSAGSPRGYRAAGSALGANPIPLVVPCHRVLRAGGALGGYGGGLDVKERLLSLEGAR